MINTQGGRVMFTTGKTYTLRSGAKATIERVQMEQRGGGIVPGRVRYVVAGMPRITVTAETWEQSIELAPAKAPEAKAKPKARAKAKPKQ